MAIPTVVATNTRSHAVCSVQVLENGLNASVCKAEALNSHGLFNPIVIVTRHASEHNNEYQFITAILMTVRIVEVRAGDDSIMPVPSIRTFPDGTR